MTKTLPDNLTNKKIILCKEDPYFVSPQGEGKYMGRLSTWLRVSTCNLKCSWLNPNGEVTLCDTAYTSHKPERNIQTAQQVYDQLNDKFRYVVITGGEPSTQSNVIELIDHLELQANKNVTIETNATNFFESSASLISMSPKLESSGEGLKAWSQNKITPDTDKFIFKLFYPEASSVADLNQDQLEKLKKTYERFHQSHQQARYNPKAIQQFMEFYGPDRYQFKFVANCEQDIEEIQDKYVIPFNIPEDNVWLMPQGIFHDQLNERAEWIVDQCKKYNWNYSDRIHIRIWGNKTGV